MKQLTKEAFQKAANYLKNKGRKIDLAWYRREFESAPVSEVLAALQAYQCENGGFGKMLEPDHRTALSSCYTTSTAFGWIGRLGISGDSSIVQKALGYLRENYNSVTCRWPAFPKEAGRDPHAIWWHVNDGEDLCDAEKTWGLPAAELTGVMLRYDPEGSIAQRCFDTAMRRIDEVYPAMDMNEASCYARMAAYLEGSRRELVIEKMTGVLEHILETDDSKWNEYSAKPLMYIHSPASPFYGPFRELTDQNLDWEIGRQTEAGCWDPTWQWYRDEEYWPEARAEWQSCLTAENLVMLKNFGRLESENI